MPDGDGTEAPPPEMPEAEAEPLDEEEPPESLDENEVLGPEGAESFEAGEREVREIAGEVATERSDFLGLMGHFYRGEMSRATTWRDRLDRTSNWAVVLVASLVTFAFSAENPHSILLLGMLIVGFFLIIEARRYRMYDVWRTRVRAIEENVFANALEPAGVQQREWRALLSKDLRFPKIKISFLEAAARRLRRIYMALFLILALAWVAHLTLDAGTPWQAVPEASIWIVPGEVVVGAVAGLHVLLAALALWPMEREAKGELVYEQESDKWKEKNQDEGS